MLVYKRLESGRFRLPKVAAGATSMTLDASTLAMLLDGVDLASVRRVPAWKPGAIDLERLHEGIDSRDRS